MKEEARQAKEEATQAKNLEKQEAAQAKNLEKQEAALAKMREKEELQAKQQEVNQAEKEKVFQERLHMGCLQCVTL